MMVRHETCGPRLGLAPMSRKNRETWGTRLFYLFNGEEVFVLRIVHGARDLEGLF